MYGRGEIEFEHAKSVLTGVGTIVLVDVIADKAFGQIPILGIASNYFCAKVLTWRLGAIFTFFASRGETVETGLAKHCATFLKDLFPKADFGVLRTPDKERFIEFVARTSKGSARDVEERIQRAMDALSGDS